MLIKGLGFNVSNGMITKFWLDDWLPCGPLLDYAMRELSEEEAERSVSDYCESAGHWRFDLLQDKLPEIIIHVIAAAWVDPSSEGSDTVIWKLTNDGNLSTKSAYSIQIMGHCALGSSYNHWRGRGPP